MEVQQRRAEREHQQAERLQQIANLEELEEQLTSVHTVDFAQAFPPKAPAPAAVEIDEIRRRIEGELGVPALEGEIKPFGSPPQAPAAEPVNQQAVIARHRKEALRGVPLLRFGERRRVKEKALAAARGEIAEEEARRAAARSEDQKRLDGLWHELEEKRDEAAKRAEGEARAETERRAQAHREQQERLDRDWALLQENDPATVIRVLEAAFADNEAPAAPLDCQGGAVTVAMRFGGPDLVPEMRPDLTPAGRPTMKKRSKTDRNTLYFEAMSSNVLATAKEAFAVAPGINELAILVVREETNGPAEGRLAAIYAGRFSRGDDGVLSSRYPGIELEDAEDALINRRGRTKEVAPLDLRKEPELQEVLVQIAEGMGLEPLEASKRKQPPGR